MKLSVGLTIWERETPVLEAVFGSLRGQPWDEMVIVFDRSPAGLRDHVRSYYANDGRVKYVELEGPPGWGSPVPGWNACFAAMTGTHLYAFSSEVVHAPQNVEVARRMMEANPHTAIFGKCLCSCGPEGREVNWGGQAPGNLLVDAAHPRPLGFIWACPLETVRKVGGMDAEFAGGFWFDDDDFMFRLWQAGLDFTFTDDISGTHLHHDRATLDSPAGQAGIQRNAAYMLKKHGTLHPLAGVQKMASYLPGRTTWRHL